MEHYTYTKTWYEMLDRLCFWKQFTLDTLVWYTSLIAGFLIDVFCIIVLFKIAKQVIGKHKTEKLIDILSKVKYWLIALIVVIIIRIICKLYYHFSFT